MLYILNIIDKHKLTTCFVIVKIKCENDYRIYSFKMPCSICGKLGHNRRTCMSFNKIQEKKSYDIISDSDSESDNESDNESKNEYDDNECDEKNIVDDLDFNKLNLDDSEKKKETFNLIKEKLRERFTIDVIKGLKTKSGKTQSSERNYIRIIQSVLDELKFTYTKAGSQQSKDFRNINNTGLNLEGKKTDSFNTFCNDTCPCSDIEYIVIFTGTKYKVKKNIKPQIIFINGNEIIQDCGWLNEFKRELKILLDKYCRGENKKRMKGLLKVYVRPTYQFSIKTLLKN